MPRPPLTSEAVNELAKYFGAISDASFIDRTWQIATTVKNSRDLIKSGSTRSDNSDFYRNLQNADPGAINGTSTAENLAELVNGCVSFESFLEATNNFDAYKDQFEFFKPSVDLGQDPPKNQIKKIENLDQTGWNRKNDKVYAMNVMNPYLGPTTRDTGAVEVFANSIPTIELSKCVPYINIDLISLYKTEKSAPPMSLIGFLNPKNLSGVDQAMIDSQKSDVRSEAGSLGAGYKSGIELFLMPQTLTNQGEVDSTYAPVIDRMRPLMSLKGLNLSTKVQGGTLSFTSGKLELILHDRSRMRDVAAFVRPDLYGTTFLDITYGWSHPDGSSSSDNSFGKLLNSFKNETRYRISNATYSFEEGGQVNIGLSIQTVGSIDLLYLGPKTNNEIAQLNELFSRLNERISEIKSRTKAPSMDAFNFLKGVEDQYSILKNAFTPEFQKKLKDSLKSATDPEIKNIINELLSNGDTGAIDVAKNTIVESYTSILNSVPTFATRVGNSISSKFENANFEDLHRDDKKSVDHKGEYFSYGDFFMNYVAAPIVRSGNYDEVQVIFYPFNKYAGAVHDMPISCFPIQTNRFVKMINEAVQTTPEITIRTLLNYVNARFTGFQADRSYLLAEFYDSTAADAGELKESKAQNKATEVVVKNGELTNLEQRCQQAEIPELVLKPAVVETFVEASKLYDVKGNPIIENGRTLTLLKIHVYDAAHDPHTTLTDILSSARNNQLDLIRIPISDYNMDNKDKTKKLIAMDAIKLAEENGLLQAITINNEDIKLPNADLEASLKNLKILRLNGDYEQLKRLVSKGMPTITYGSSTSVITNASFSSNSSAGLGNVLLQRAFIEPASTSADNIGTGPPMQVIPATLSMTTIGCPLFYPMQRFFVDFGTGTSIDNVYLVMNVDNKISKDGYTTDIKFGLADGWAMSRSLNQNLALMIASLNKGTTSGVQPAIVNNIQNAVEKIPDPLELTLGWFHSLLVRALIPPIEIKIEVEERIREEIAKIQQKVIAKVEEEKQKAIAKIEAAIPEAVKKAAVTAQEKKEEIDYKITQAQIIAARIQYLATLTTLIPTIASQIGQKAADKLAEEVKTATAEAEAQAAENNKNDAN